jgi:hypothetical protein
MNTFTLLTTLGALGVIASFMSGVRAMRRYGDGRCTRGTASIAWRMVFDMTVFLTILAAPLAR